MLSGEAFWSFSCSHYEKQGVKGACLKLQNEYDFNVNVILMCCFLQKQNLSLSEAQLRECLKATNESDQHLKSLRINRMALKAFNEQAYGHMLKAELELERQQQQELIKVLNQQLLQPLESGRNLETYLRCLRLSNEADVRASVTLIDTIK